MDAPDDGQDVIEHGDQRAPGGLNGRPGPVVLAVSALAVGLIGGYLVG
jgi:hypothetical protein